MDDEISIGELNFILSVWEGNQIFVYMVCVSLTALSSLCHLVKVSKFNFKRAGNQNSCLVDSSHDLKPVLLLLKAMS